MSCIRSCTFAFYAYMLFYTNSKTTIHVEYVSPPKHKNIILLIPNLGDFSSSFNTQDMADLCHKCHFSQRTQRHPLQYFTVCLHKNSLPEFGGVPARGPLTPSSFVLGYARPSRRQRQAPEGAAPFLLPQPGKNEDAAAAPSRARSWTLVLENDRSFYTCSAFPTSSPRGSAPGRPASSARPAAGSRSGA